MTRTEAIIRANERFAAEMKADGLELCPDCDGATWTPAGTLCCECAKDRPFVRLAILMAVATI